MSADSSRLRPARRLEPSGRELETLSMPTEPVAVVVYPKPEAPRPPVPVARSKSGRWQKGCPSPNPDGRPRKQELGDVTSRMAEIVAVSDNGRSVSMTRREYLDRVTMRNATTRGPDWRKLWEERLKHDAAIRAAEEEAEQEAARLAAGPKRPNVVTSHGAGDMSSVYDGFNRLFDHGLAVVVELGRMGATVRVDGRIAVADWLERSRRELPLEA